MTDNRDIDEILASLDALLREGSSHNDDIPAEPVPESLDADSLEVALEADVALIETAAEAFSHHDDVDEVAAEAVIDDRQEEGLSRVVLTEDMMVENHQVSLPLGFMAKELNEDNVAVSEPSALETLASDGVIADDIVQDVVADEHGIDDHMLHLHKQQVEQLLALVSLDVSNHVQQMLPKLMKDSLHAHLADMQHESDENNKTSDDK